MEGISLEVNWNSRASGLSFKRRMNERELLKGSGLIWPALSGYPENAGPKRGRGTRDVFAYSRGVTTE